MCTTCKVGDAVNAKGDKATIGGLAAMQKMLAKACKPTGTCAAPAPKPAAAKKTCMTEFMATTQSMAGVCKESKTKCSTECQKLVCAGRS